MGVARWLISEWCAPWVKSSQVSEDTVEALLLLSSEVVTNAVVHGSGMVRVALSRRGDSLRLEVSDEGGGMPLIGAQREDAESGRGMAMVEMLSQRWGTELDEGPLGKKVWFELADA
ncbi:ATP-binding protein [Kineococcus sp. SYSU DK005]|uniref:ATP-binding protein n=1 Tax=Kineococcus sp. SYSU DK005 TaxID=3383126 RepID=UPI003D7DDC8C